MMTLEQFRATRTECADLGERFGAEYFDKAPRAGFVYAGEAYIEREPDGSFYVRLYRDDYASNNLAELEARLYAWALTERAEDMGVNLCDWREFLSALVEGEAPHVTDSLADYRGSIAETVMAVLDISELSETAWSHLDTIARAKFAALGMDTRES